MVEAVCGSNQVPGLLNVAIHLGVYRLERVILFSCSEYLICRIHGYSIREIIFSQIIFLGGHMDAVFLDYI